MADSDIRVSSGNFITAKPVGVINGVDFGHTGEVRKVDAEGIRRRLDDDEVVLISPVGFSPSGEVFNCTLEDVAKSVATAVRADKLIFLMESANVADLRGKPISELTVRVAHELAAQNPPWNDDIKFYLPSALYAVRAGVGRAHFISRHVDGALLLELFTHHGIGTMLVPEAPEQLRSADAVDLDGVIGLIEPLEQKGILVYRDRQQLADDISNFTVLELDEDGRHADKKIIGCVAYYRFGEDKVAELACLAVNPHYRDGGRGERLLKHVETQARKDGMKSIFVLSTQTMQWFSERGFVEMPLDALPLRRRERYNVDRKSKIYSKTL
jgi:amino-acid N-acetyltransferase